MFIQDECRGANIDILENPLIFDLTSNSGFCLAANSIMRMRPGSVLVVALCCESFSIMSLGFRVMHCLRGVAVDLLHSVIGPLNQLLDLRSRAVPGRSIIFRAVCEDWKSFPCSSSDATIACSLQRLPVSSRTARLFMLTAAPPFLMVCGACRGVSSTILPWLNPRSI